jgi:hypothetical protein
MSAPIDTYMRGYGKRLGVMQLGEQPERLQ